MRTRVFWSVRVLDHGNGLPVILKYMIRNYQIRLRKAKEIAVQTPNVVYIMEKEEADRFVYELAERDVIYEMKRTQAGEKGIFYLDNTPAVSSDTAIVSSKMSVSCRKKRPYYNVRILDLNNQRSMAIKMIRHAFQIDEKEAEEAADQVPDAVFKLGEMEAGRFIQRLEFYGITCSKKKTRNRTKGILYPH